LVQSDNRKHADTGHIVFASAYAQNAITVDKLIEFSRSSIPLVQQKKMTDSKLADSLKAYKLTQRLNDRAIDELQQEGLPPKTVAALRSMAAASASLPSVEVKKIEPPAPPPEEPPPQAKLREKFWMPRASTLSTIPIPCRSFA